MTFLIDLFDRAHQALFELLVQPLMFALGLGNLLEDGYEGTRWLLVGLLQIALLLTVLRALERWRPIAPVLDRRSVRVDLIYTFIHRLGLFRIALFFMVDPLWDALLGWWRMGELPRLQLDQLWPGVTDIGWVSFVLYLLVFDLVGYALHRAQHRFDWWWQLHALHHSARELTCVSDNRNHLLDDLVCDSLFVGVGVLIGIPPGQFIAAVALTQLLESLSHANVRLSFGPLERWIVSPRFHRYHHRIGDGGLDDGFGRPGGHNFGVLLPLWDRLFGTAHFGGGFAAAGLPDEGALDYRRGFWAQQWIGLRRLAGCAGRWAQFAARRRACQPPSAL